MGNTIITIGRQFCSLGNEIGSRLAEQLGIPYYDQFILKKAAEEEGISVERATRIDERAATPFEISLAAASFFYSTAGSQQTQQEVLTEAQTRTILSLADQGSCVIVGRCADYILREHPNVLHVFIYADYDRRIQTAMQQFGKDERGAKKLLKKVEKERSDYYHANTGRNWRDPSNYDIMLNSAHFGIEGAAKVLMHAYNNLKV